MIVFVSAALFGCANTPSSSLDAAILAPLHEPASPGKSNIDIYRTEDLLYMAAKATVDINGERVAELWRGESFSANYDPGRLVITTDSWGSPGEFTLVITTEPDTEYLLEISPREELMNSALFGYAGAIVDAEVNENSGPFKLTIKKVTRNNRVNPAYLPNKTQAPTSIDKPNEPKVIEEDLVSKTPSTLREKLDELKHLYESGLISEDVYLEQQRKLLEANQLQ